MSPAPLSAPVLHVAGVQMRSSRAIDRNLEDAAALIAAAAAAGAQLVVLPEYFCLMGEAGAFSGVAEVPGDGPLQHFLSAQARLHGVWLAGGTIPLRSADADRAYNSLTVWGPQGTLVARYDKLHLFTLREGDRSHEESRELMAGSMPTAFTVHLDGWDVRIGLSICYDLRFPELYRALIPCDLLLVPSAFTATTGAAHWHTLLRARAIENQCYVLAPAQSGTHDTGRNTYGHTMLIDPWGETVGERAEGAGIVTGAVRAERIAEVRRRLPALTHRRAEFAASPASHSDDANHAGSSV